MATPTQLDTLDLAALISSRLCHDVISPVGAIVNGLEILDEDDDPQMREFALDLVKKSARQASNRLQFARLAFGAAGSAGAAIDLADAEQMARGAVLDSKAELVWNAPRALLPKNHVKVLLNLVVIALTTIPRGGKLNVTVEGTNAHATFRLETEGVSARIPAGLVDLLAGSTTEGRVDAHNIQPYYTHLVARAAKLDIFITQEGDKVSITAGPNAQSLAEPLEPTAMIG
jgi:histidine phosphotransferase ChpT